MSGRLHRKPGHPYYILAPDYRETSSGVCTLHYLCHALNLEGFEAYIVGASRVNPDLKTPLLNTVIKKSHEQSGKVPIGVYPEVVSGNPLMTPVVVRYMLNREGVVGGNRINADVDDLFFYFREEFVESGRSADLLTLPGSDMELFSPEPGVVKTSRLLYLNRIPRDAIDFSTLPLGVEILSVADPLPLSQLALKLKSAEVLYSFEVSSTCTKAMLCGCPVVALTAEGFEHLAFTEETLNFYHHCGVALDDSAESLQKAISGLSTIRTWHAELESCFWDQLVVFTRKTQAAASTRTTQLGRRQLLAWLAERVPTKIEHALISQHLEQKVVPSFGLLVVDLEGSTDRLMTTIKSLSLEHNLYASVRILVFTTAQAPKTSCEDKLHFIGVEPDTMVERINQNVAASAFDWLMLVEAGDEFAPSGLMMAALELMEMPDCRALYGDELQRVGKGDLGAALRPGLNLDLLLSFPSAMARHWLFRRDLFVACGGFDPAFSAALELDLLLRLIEQGGIVGLEHIAETLLTCNAPLLQDNPVERATIERHLRVRGYPDVYVSSVLPGRYLIDYGHPQQPLVSIVLTMWDRLDSVQRCIDSLLEKTRYDNYELLIVDNASNAEDICAWLDAVEALGDNKVRVLRYRQAYNAAAITNYGVAAARGDYVLLLDSDTVVIREDWLEHLLNHAQRPEVGIVGGRLLCPDGKTLGAGLILGLNGPATPAFIDEPMDSAGYMQRLQLDQSFSAVSASCLMIRRTLFEEVGGMDEVALQVTFYDVDLCLKVREAGYLTVWTPHAVLLSEGRGSPQLLAVRHERQVYEQDVMYARWLPQLANDPAYNRNLLLNGKGFELEVDSKLTWRPLLWKPLPVVLAHPADAHGCGHYRVIRPFKALKEAGLVDGMLSGGLLHVTDLERYSPDVILLQRQIGEERLEAMRRIKKFSGAFKVYELDDYLPNLPMKSVHREHMPKDILKSLRKGLSYVDRFVVSTEPLAEAFAGLHGDIRVIKNRLPAEWWSDLQSKRRQGRKPRVGWAGGISHTGDLDLITDVVKALANEVEWVFFGMCPPKIRPFVHEFHPGVDIDSYAQSLAGLNLDLALAPVEQNLFNECKSNLRLLEYGACGVPVVCSDLICYRGDLPVTRVKNRFKDWVDAIRDHIHDLDEAGKQGDSLREQILSHWLLEGQNVEAWRKAWLPD